MNYSLLRSFGWCFVGTCFGAVATCVLYLAFGKKALMLAAFIPLSIALSWLMLWMSHKETKRNLEQWGSAFKKSSESDDLDGDRGPSTRAKALAQDDNREDPS